MPAVKKFTRIFDSLSVEVSVGTSLFGVPREVAPGWSANSKLSSDALCPAVLYEVYERKPSIFRMSKLPPLSTLCSLAHFVCRS